MIFAAAAYGVFAVLVFRTFTNPAKLRRSANLIAAHVMELGLFLDSPSLVLRAQRDLLLENARLLRMVLLPGAIMALLFWAADSIYAHAPLPVGQSSVITIQMKPGPMPDVQLDPPDGIVVESPAVRVLHDNQISWRIRPIRQNTGALKFSDPSIRKVFIPYPKSEAWLLPFLSTSTISALLFGIWIPR
jgi:hypothetical protein